MKECTLISKPVRRVFVAACLSVGMIVGSVVGAPTAEAATLPLDYEVTATTYIKKMDLEDTIEGGTFVGEVDLETGELVADLSLPPSETTVDLIGLPLATAGFATEPTGPVTGTVDLATMQAETTAEFHIRITHLRPLGLSLLNLVGHTCRTSTPITIQSTVQIDLENPMQLEAEFEIPEFENCGLATPVLNQMIPGPGNTFSATLE